MYTQKRYYKKRTHERSKIFYMFILHTNIRINIYVQWPTRSITINKANIYEMKKYLIKLNVNNKDEMKWNVDTEYKKQYIRRFVPVKPLNGVTKEGLYEH